MFLRGRRHCGGRKNELVFLTTCGPAATFDPKIVGPDGIWYFDDDTTISAASGAEISKTFAAEGLHRAVYRPASGGLAAITAINCDTDLLTSISPSLKRCTRLITLSSYNNSSLSIGGIVPPNIITFYGNFVPFSVDTAEIPNATAIDCGSTLFGPVSNFSRSAINITCASSRLTGSLADLPVTIRKFYNYNNTYLSSGSISHAIDSRDIQVHNMGWLTADVDVVLLSVSDAIWANPGHFTYATLVLQIGGTNEAPSGTIGAATTSPLVTPGAGNSDADWLWVAGVSEHYPVSGCAAVYYMRNNVGHAWAVTITGEA